MLPRLVGAQPFEGALTIDRTKLKKSPRKRLSDRKANFEMQFTRRDGPPGFARREVVPAVGSQVALAWALSRRFLGANAILA